MSSGVEGTVPSSWYIEIKAERDRLLREVEEAVAAHADTCADPSCPIHGESDHNLIPEGEFDG